MRVTYEITFADGEKENPRPKIFFLKEPTTFGIDLLVKANKQSKSCYQSSWTLGIYGAFVNKICGISNDAAKGKFWFFYVNNKLADVGVSCFKLKNGDRMRFTFQKTPDNKI